MKSLLWFLLGAGAYYMYQKHVTATEAANLQQSIKTVQNADGSYTVTMPDGSSVTMDAAAVQWIQALMPQTSAAQTSAATAAAAAPATTTAAAPALGALQFTTRGKTTVPARPIYMPPAQGGPAGRRILTH